MKKNKIAHKSLTTLFTTGATIAVGFLSFAGMFVLTSSLIWCGAAFVLAAAYEGQVNAEGISSAFRRMFDKNHLKRGILHRYFEEQLEEEDETNIFLNDYRIQKKYLADLEAIKRPTEEHHKKIHAAKKQLALMRAFAKTQSQQEMDNALDEALGASMVNVAAAR